MTLNFSEHAWEDYPCWQQTDRKISARINSLVKETQRAPFEGIGKPESLRHGLSGYWSRRITEEHRLVCKVEQDALIIVQLSTISDEHRHITGREFPSSGGDAASLAVQ